MIKPLVHRLLRRAGFELFNRRRYHAHDGVFTKHHARFLTDPAFAAAYQRGLEATQGADPDFPWRVHIALWAAELASRVPGAFVECGVNAGFLSSAILHHLDLGPRPYYLLDTFDGPPVEQFSEREVAEGRAEHARDAEARGAYVKDLQRIRANFAAWPNVRIIPGRIPDTLASVDAPQVAFLHLDLNCALPEREALRYFWPRLSPGGVVLLDDYCYRGHESQGDAIDELARELSAHVLALPTGQGLIMRQ